MHEFLYTCNLHNIVCQFYINKGKELCTGNSGTSLCCTSAAEHSTEGKVVLTVDLRWGGHLH